MIQATRFAALLEELVEHVSAWQRAGGWSLPCPRRR
jgi:hypothetical protein